MEFSILGYAKRILYLKVDYQLTFLFRTDWRITPFERLTLMDPFSCVGMLAPQEWWRGKSSRYWTRSC